MSDFDKLQAELAVAGLDEASLPGSPPPATSLQGEFVFGLSSIRVWEPPLMQANLILEQLRNNLVTHVVGLPDNASAALFSLLSSEETPQLVTVTREGEAFAIAAGLWVGGKNPVVLIQNTGLLESGDGLRGTVVRMRIPLVCLVTYRGYSTMAGAKLAPPRGRLHPEILSRPDIDSVAVLTEPTLKAWGLSYDFLVENDDLAKISQAFKKAKELVQPTVLLIPQDLTLA